MINQNANQIQVIKDKALQIVRNRGPVLPVQITKEFGIDVIFASALLSELVDTRAIKISNTKVGNSPVYYVAGQEAKLQALRDKLNDKQQKAFDMLKRNKILRDSEQEPVIRLSLREIKDFAHQLNVTLGNHTEIFWKWYLNSDAEAEPLIKQKLSTIIKKEPKADVQKQLEEVEDNLKRLEKKEEVKAAEKIEKEIPVKLRIGKTKGRKAKIKAKEEQKTLPQENAVDEKDKFMMKVVDDFKKDNIELLTVKQVRKNKDFEGTIRIPSAVGSITYFFKAKDKKTVTDSDLSLLFVQSQMKKMPILLITTGKVTKKAQNLLNKEFKNITIKKV